MENAEGLQWIASHRYQHMIIEFYCKHLMNDVCIDKLNSYEYGLIVQNCKTFLKNHNNYKVVFIRRQANKNAYIIQRYLSQVETGIFLAS
jgi:hypothetical protein